MTGDAKMSGGSINWLLHSPYVRALYGFTVKDRFLLEYRAVPDSRGGWEVDPAATWYKGPYDNFTATYDAALARTRRVEKNFGCDLVLINEAALVWLPPSKSGDSATVAARILKFLLDHADDPPA